MPDSPSPSTVLLEWQTLNAHPHVRGYRWYLVGGICILLFAVYGILDGSWVTALLALLLGGMYFLLRNEKPKTITVQITGIGMRVDGKLTPWNQLKDFWILVSPEFCELHCSSQGIFQSEIGVFIRDAVTPISAAPDPGAIREMLLQYLPERAGMGERMLDSFARILKL